VRDLLVSAQIALSLTLLVVAALVLRTLDSAWSTDPGFRTDDVLASYVSTSSMGTPIEERHRFYRELMERLEALPWVSAAAVADYAPLSPHGTAEVRLDEEGATAPVKVAKVVPGYFEALDIPLVAGRTFESTDTAVAPMASVAIVDEVMAQRFFGDASPLGRQISWTAPIVEGERTSRIVGVVASSRIETLLGEAEPQLYLSYPQIYTTPGNAVIIATSEDPAAAVRLLEEEYRAVDSRLAVVNVLPYSDVVEGFVYTQRMNAELFSVVALLGLVLAAVGIFGVMNLAVGLRTREIGIRLAIGAGSLDITRVVARRALLSVALGVLLGLAAAVLAVRWVEGLRYGVEPIDPLSFSAAAAVLTAAALLAAYLPTRRALGVDPMTSLRIE
jgi:predicted permease